MARTRLQLHDELMKIIGNGNCYYSPPNGFNLKYPCIVYKHENNADDYADDLHYIRFRRYTVTVIDDNPDSDLSERLLDHFRYCDLSRQFCSDNLNHWIHNLFY